MRTILLLVSTMLLLGCTVALTPEEQRIRVTTAPDTVKGCVYKGTVKGNDNWGGPLVESRKRAIENMMRNAYGIGADTVYQSNIYLAYNEFYALGEAFDCSNNKEQEVHAAR